MGFEAMRLDFFEACGTPVEPRRIQDRQGRDIYVMERGQGTPVVLIHGGGAEGCIWAPFLPELPEGTRAIVVDRPGCGLTFREDYRGVDFRAAAAAFVEDVLDALDLHQASFVANSMGGYFALCFALAHPGRVRDLALLGAPAGLDRWLPAGIRLLGTPGVNRVITWLQGEPEVEGQRELFDQKLVADVDRVPEGLLEVGVANYRGTEDAFAPPSSGQELDERMPDSQAWVIPDAGHLPWLDDPETCGRAVRGFLRLESPRVTAEG